MLVLAAVPDVQFHKLRRAAVSRFVVAQVSTWDDVLTGIRGRPVELAVVDPLLSGHARSQEIERLRVLFPSLPLMLYTTLTPSTAGELLALGQRGCRGPGTASQQRGCCTPTACCRTPASRSRTWRHGWATRRPKRCSCTRGPISGSRPEKCACPSTRAKRWRAWSSAS